MLQIFGIHSVAFRFCRCTIFLTLLTRNLKSCDQTEVVTDEVKLMDTKRAEKYRFQNTDTGAEEFQKMLLACGASLSYATKE